ncbi:MAG: response regulator [Dissulfurispiraceae bacterium]
MDTTLGNSHASILLVDDEKQFLSIFAQRLEMRGLRIEIAVSGEEAIERSSKTEFDAIVLDMEMPGMDGVTTLKRLKSANPDLQVIILTGHATTDKIVEAMKEKAMDYLEKPVDLNKLLQKIEEAQQKKILVAEKKKGDAG